MRKLTAVFLLSLFVQLVNAETFVVTSNADSGPGTLREAIEKANANGTATNDVIRFNMPQLGFKDRVINLTSALPALTSNITIDGTTQPGETYGSTHARVCIKMDLYAPSFSVLKVADAVDVKIFGLYLYYGYWEGFFSYPLRSKTLYGIELENANRITIGAPGKGNVINGVVHAIYSNSDSCRDVRIQSNFLGLKSIYTYPEVDIDDVLLNVESCITLAQVKDITIGGDTPSEGNLFGSPDRAINIDSKYSTGNGFIKIRHNVIGLEFDKTTLVDVYDFWDYYVNIGRSRNNPVDYSKEFFIDYRVEFTDNELPSHLRISHVSDSVIIQRNRFMEDFRSTTGPGTKVLIWRSPKGGVIGGDEPANANLFFKKKKYNYFSSVYLGESGPFTVLKNTFECNSVFGSTIHINHYSKDIPFVQIDETTSTYVKGRSTPNARIDLYYDDDCTACEGRIYLAKVAADAKGEWQYNGSIQGTVVATATTALGYTSEFSKPIFNTDSVVIVQPTCGKKNGSITNIKAEGAESYYWVRHEYPKTPDTVSWSLDLIDAGPGEYILHGVHGGTCVNTIYQSYVLQDLTPKAEKHWTDVTQPSCGLFNGAINGIVISNGQNAGWKWINNQGQTISSDMSVSGLGPGTYRFVVTDTTSRGGCSDTAIFVLANLSGPTVHTDNIRIADAICGMNKGSLTGITVSNASASPFIRWIDSLGNEVGSALDLLNVKPGKYRLQFKDAGLCDTITTPYYTVGDTGGINFVMNNMVTQPAKCEGGGGSIQGIGAPGGESFLWTNTGAGTTVGSALDVLNLPAGNYQLTATNSYGCTKILSPVTVPQAAFDPIHVLDARGVPATCGLSNGSYTVNRFSKDTGLYDFRWIDSASGSVISRVTNLFNISNGTYILFARDSNGCEAQILHVLLLGPPMPSFDYTGMQVKPDQCLTGSGAISGLVVNNLPGGTTVYEWTDSNGQRVGNALAAGNLPQGNYTLQVTDSWGCKVTSAAITVPNNNTTLTNPLYDEQSILKNTAATLMVKNPQAGSYRLFDSPSATTPLQQNTTGIFTTPALSADKLYWVQYVNGVCASERVPVWVKVVDKTAVYVPTAFSPNGDGKNDLLKAIPIGKVKLTRFTVYDRWGGIVFSTSNFSGGWNGTYQGKLLETGVYVWTLKAVDELTGTTIEQKGTVALLR
ncbi:MAG: gliding motility-associated C-terminal domain-containing protein [Chitinophagaceae bacterium]|nr:MAG: gliding motility-associated C-terminal domain-containing protein [Chitinophagaceae bacterium]